MLSDGGSLRFPILGLLFCGGVHGVDRRPLLRSPLFRTLGAYLGVIWAHSGLLGGFWGLEGSLLAP